MTQYEAARQGRVTPEMRRVAERENTTAERIGTEIAAGRLVIPANRVHLAGEGGTPLDACGIGRAMTTKINANIGASPLASDRAGELCKLRWARRWGADTVMDLSTGGDLDAIRADIIGHSDMPVGTVPIYSMIAGDDGAARPVEELTGRDILETIERQAAQGVDFFTIHAGLLREHLPLAAERVTGIVSRGGSLLAKWMMYHDRQNPMYELFDDISAIMRAYDVCYSLGDGLRPGCLADASDEAQFAELDVLGELVVRARQAGVQVMVEGPGHVPFDQIEMNMKRQEAVCDGAPFYVLGPLVTDAFPGYDHITSAIGATAAAVHGASFLCYVTPAEHLGLPGPEDVKAGCVAYKIAAHAADVARGLPGARNVDDRISRARADLDWEGVFAAAFDSDAARRGRQAVSGDEDYCAMCGRDWCAVRISKSLTEQMRARPAGAARPAPESDTGAAARPR